MLGKLRDWKKPRWLAMTLRYAPSIAAGVVVGFIYDCGSDASTLFGTIAQVAAALLIAVLLEASWTLSRVERVRATLFSNLDRGEQSTAKSDELLAEAERLNNTDPAVDGLRESAKKLGESLDETRKQLDDNTRTIVAMRGSLIEVFCYGAIAIGVSVASIASGSSSAVLLGVSVFALSMIGTNIYSLFMLRFKLVLIKPVSPQ